MSVDCNVMLSRWPFRRVPNDSVSKLAEELNRHGIDEAWAGSFDALLHRDMAGVNLCLVEQCRSVEDLRLLPFGTVHPGLPDWEEDLRRCAEEHGMQGIRLFPNYHQYTLDDPRLAQLLAAASRRGMLVQVVVKMEDERTQHPLLRVPAVDLEPLGELVDRMPKLRVMVLNGLRGDVRPELIERLNATGRVQFDLAMLEGAAGVRKWIDRFGKDHLTLGTFSPLFYTESSLLKLEESELGQVERRAVLGENAKRLLG